MRAASLVVCVLIGFPAGPVVAQTASRQIDIGGVELYIECHGVGTPTVVVDAGAGSWSIYYRSILEELAGLTRVCAYDRAGLGRSAALAGPRTSSRMADELHRLLVAAGEPGPYVLAGHSLGGYNVRIFQRRHASDVAALVLLDSGHERQWDRLPLIWAAVEASAVQSEQLADAVAAGQVTMADLRPWPIELSRDASDDYERAMMDPKVHRATAAEFASARISAGQVPVGTLGDLPLVVATAGRSFDEFRGLGLPLDGADEVWADLQADFLRLSSAAEQRISPGGTHNLVVTDPIFVIEAIARGVELARERMRERVSAAPQSGAWTHRLPEVSEPWIDDALLRVEEVTRDMDVEAFVAAFAPGIEQLDVPRRVHIVGRDGWRAQTQRLIGAHRWMERVHHGRLMIGPRTVVAEIEWAGTVRGAALGEGAADRTYRYSGLALIDFDGDDRIERQLLFGDITTLLENLGESAQAWTLLGVSGGPPSPTNR